MYRTVLFFVCLINGFFVGDAKETTSSAIPDLLYDCYRNSTTLSPEQPLTIRSLVELIRKIEMRSEIASNARILATSMLHGVVLDGIRRSEYGGDAFMIPYRATGEEFYKYKLTVDYLTSGESSLFPADALTTPELCFLHTMVSNTVDGWVRGDESTTCTHQSKMPFELSAMEENHQISNCPIKKGNVNTKWGAVSAGHIIAATASALQQTTATFERIELSINNASDKNVTSVPPTIVTNTNNVNNVWISTIAGDLATVILKQAQYTPEIGTDGFWNDTLLPRIYYLKSTNWDMTETDILGGIDGLAIAHYFKNHDVSSTRLSQLIDMYYSERGIMNNGEYKVTNRSATLNKLLNEISLEEQVANTAKLLQKIGTYDVYLSSQNIDKLATAVTDQFKTIAGEVTKKYDNVEGIHGRQIKSPIEIIVIFDGSYEAYTAQRIIHGLTEAAEVSHLGSKLGVINGQSGNWMANVTGDLFQLFRDLHQSKSDWPSSLSLGRSLTTVSYYYDNKTTANCKAKPMGRSILIVTKSGRLTDNDFESSRRAFNTIKNSNPETSFVVVTTPEGKDAFSELTARFRDNDYVLTPPEQTHSLIQNVSSTLSTIPANIVNFHCSQGEVRLTDYVTPNVTAFYQIRREHVQASHIVTKFSSSGHLSVCAFVTDSTTENNEICKDITVNDEISFDSVELCAPEPACNLEFRVSVNATEISCEETSCRYPDQVRVDIIWQRSSAVPVASTVQLSLIAFIMMLSF